jgi:hypothetical protein
MLLSYEDSFTASGPATMQQDITTSAAQSHARLPLPVGGASDGKPVQMDVRVTEAFAGETTTTLTTSLRAYTGLSATTYVTLLSSAALTKSTLVAGYRLPFTVLPPVPYGYTHIGLYFTKSGAVFTGGGITGGIVMDRGSDGYSVTKALAAA